MTTCSLKNTRIEFLSLGTLSILGSITFCWEGLPCSQQGMVIPHQPSPTQRHSETFGNGWSLQEWLETFLFVTPGRAAGFCWVDAVDASKHSTVHRQPFSKRIIQPKMSVMPSVISSGLQWSCKTFWKKQGLCQKKRECADVWAGRIDNMMCLRDSKLSRPKAGAS